MLYNLPTINCATAIFNALSLYTPARFTNATCKQQP